MFKNIYLHRTTQSIELMLCDAMIDSNNIYKFNEVVEDPKEYLKLTDYIFHDLQHNPKISEYAKNLIQKILHRELYTFVAEKLIAGDKKVDKDEIKKYFSQNKIDEGCYEIVISKINYCNKNQDPTEAVRFYNKSDPNKKFQLKKEEISLLAPSQFQEWIVRVFVKESEPDKLTIIGKKIRQALKAYMEQNDYGSEISKLDKITPSKSPKR